MDGLPKVICLGLPKQKALQNPNPFQPLFWVLERKFHLLLLLLFIKNSPFTCYFHGIIDTLFS
jgi:hypothetical protein